MTDKAPLDVETYIAVVEDIQVSSGDVGATVMALLAIARAVTELKDEVAALKQQISDDAFGINQEIARFHETQQ